MIDTILRPQAQRVSWRARSVAGRVGARGLVLLYHRVSKLDLDPWALAVSPTNFDEQLQVLRERYAPVHLRSLRSELKDPSIDRLPVAITFDDGYADNVLNALPLLERHAMPATVFIVPTAIDATREFWWDELEQLAFPAGEHPAELTTRIDGRAVTWSVPPGAAPQSSAGWRGWQPPQNEHQQLYQDMWRALQVLEPRERVDAMDVLWDGWRRKPQARDSHRAATSAEFDKLAAGKLIEIGAHTLSHARLSSLPEAEQLAEIAASKAQLEERLNRRVSTFSYPHGGHADFTSATARLVREAGFRLACTAYPGLTRTWTDRYRLPRVVVEDWDGDEFGRRLADWLPG